MSATDVYGTTSTSRHAISRFQSVCKFGSRGHSESVGGHGDSSFPSDEGIRKLSAAVATAAKDDPVAFSVLERANDASQVEQHMADAIARIRKNGRDASLTAPQRGALEAIVLLIGRPALFIKNDDFDLPDGEWEILAPHRPNIRDAVKSVGQIGISMAYGGPYVGTGFVVAPNTILTNRHVVERFVVRIAERWILDPGCKMRIDFKQEFGVAEKAQFPIEGVIWIADKEPDLALMKLDSKSVAPRTPPPPLCLQSNSNYVTDNNQVYVVGYPAADPGRNDPLEMHRIFEGVYEKKRLSPGRILAVDGEHGRLAHDCSTLGGSSGSCVIDMATNSVVGLHFEGNYRVSNKAVLLPSLVGRDEYRALNFRDGRNA